MVVKGKNQRRFITKAEEFVQTRECEEIFDKIIKRSIDNTCTNSVNISRSCYSYINFIRCVDVNYFNIDVLLNSINIVIVFSFFFISNILIFLSNPSGIIFRMLNGTITKMLTRVYDYFSKGYISNGLWETYSFLNLLGKKVRKEFIETHPRSCNIDQCHGSILFLCFVRC